MMELLPLFLFLGAIVVLLLGYSVAFSLAGTGLIFAGIGILTGHFEPASWKPCRTACSAL